MPQLSIFTPCEKVIVDLNTKVPSLIGIFQAMKVPVSDAPIPARAVAPVKWAVFALWNHSSKEKNIEYTQHLQIFDAAGELFSETVQKFMITEPDDHQSKNTVEVFGLPVSHEGAIRLRVWLEGAENSASECHFEVKHIRSTPIEIPTGAPVN